MAENVDFAQGGQPLRGVVLCCTALSQDARNHVAEDATTMGAVHKLDLTSDVTHLIVGNTTTPKYRYVAKERPDIKVLHQDWMAAVKAAWMAAGDVDLQGLEQKHRMPTFAGLQVCVTGFEDVEQRNHISTTVEEQGALYSGDLTKAVTHLIASAPQGAKYVHAKQWGINIVSLQWFKDSLQRGMVLDETLYDPVMPVEEQGRGAFRQYARPRTSLGKHDRDGESQGAESIGDGRKRLRRTASTRLNSQSQDMWQDLSVREVAKGQPIDNQWNDSGAHTESHTLEPSITDANSDSNANRHGITPAPSSDDVQAPEGLFSGARCLVHGFEATKKSLLENILQQNAAVVLNAPSELTDANRTRRDDRQYLLVPRLETQSSERPPDLPTGIVVATEWWVERCIHYKRLLDPCEDVLSRPMKDRAIADFDESFILSSTGFNGVDLRQIAQVVETIGAKYQEKLTPSSSVLVCASLQVKKEKAFYAQKHSIPIVSGDWLLTCLSTQAKVPFEDFQIRLPAFDAAEFASEHATSNSAPRPMSARKGDDAYHKKDVSTVKRHPLPRRKHATPSLPLQVSRGAAVGRVAKAQPFFHEDDDAGSLSFGHDDPAPSPLHRGHAGSQPLQELSPNLSPGMTAKPPLPADQGVPNKKSELPQAQPTATKLSKASSPTKSPTKSAPKQLEPETETADLPSNSKPRHDLTADLAELLSRQVASRPNSAGPVTAAEPPKRKCRPLGRAASGLSNRSMSASAQSEIIPADFSASPGDFSNAATARDPAPPQSTQLGYETAEAEAHRLQMSKTIGTKVLQGDDDGMRRVAGLGTVKDSSFRDEGGVGNRVRGRQRGK